MPAAKYFHGIGVVCKTQMADQHHSHTHAVSAKQAGSSAFVTGIILNLAFVIVEAVVGLMNHSMSLLTDAGHNLSDVSSLFISLLAFKLARKKPTEDYTYGYKKTTILAALVNAVILLVALGVIGYESIMRLFEPVRIEGNKIAWVAGVGIVVNSISAYLFYKNKEQDLNIKGAYLHLLADALVSLGVVAAGIVIQFTDWYWLDPVTGLAIMVVILISTWSLLRDSFKMSIDAVPEGIDVNRIRAAVLSVKGVSAFHHIHIWPLSTTETALTAHLVAEKHLSFEEQTGLVKKVKHELEHHGIQHSTIELEGRAPHDGSAIHDDSAG
jgi:cobalt-zinc-cadmium efflux system protein